MQKLQHENYVHLREGSTTLEKDSCGEKVLLLSDGTILKLFRRKHLISSALLYPYAQRFANNASVLQRLDIPCPVVIDTYRIPSIQRDAVHYQPLPGVSLRQIRLQGQNCPADLFERLGQFTALLHHKGIYFRSIHLGNVILTPEGELGLIDIADLQHQSRPLGRLKVERNFKHMLRDKDDSQWLSSKCRGDFWHAYQAAANRLRGR
ncbi:toluene tolerance protein [Ectopseudomonas mendocina]